jgi:hypothetical protein
MGPMTIKKEYTVFSAEGYQYMTTFKDKKPTRFVNLYVGTGSDRITLELTIDEAKQVIQEIEDAIKKSKKKDNYPF